MVLSRDLRQTLLLWASMGLLGSRIQTGSRTETEMDVVANRMSVLSGKICTSRTLFSQKNSDFLLQNLLDIRFREQQIKSQTFQILNMKQNMPLHQFM